MAVEIQDFYNEIAVQGETFDSMAYRLYDEERMSKYLREYNPQYSDIIVFEGGETLIVPVVNEAESKENLAPWRR